MRRILVAGNWKMHGSRAMVDELLGGVLQGTETLDAVDIAVFPPAPYLDQVAALCGDSSIEWGAQTLSPHREGAFTGEISASMILDQGCRYVLVGHSERRTLFGETDGDVADRFVAAREAGLEPVLCVGETLEEREAGVTENVVARQLNAVISRTGIEVFDQAIVAYEPVWAIGTGLTASPQQAQAVHAFLRSTLTALDDTIGGQIRILYGGSVKASNAAELFSQEDIDGALVGGASLTADGFVGICRAVT